MLKTIVGSITAILLLALAACDDGSAPPQAGGTGETGSISATPDASAPTGTGTDMAQ